MTSDPKPSDGTLIDDDMCFGDVFTMQSQFLDDFEFGLEATALEANSIDSLLELFEEHQKGADQSPRRRTNRPSKCPKTGTAFNNIVIKANTTADTRVVVTSPKSGPNRSQSVANKSKGVSLLAKQHRSSPKSSPKRSLLYNMNDKCLDTMSSHILQEHDYCLMNASENQMKLYNKLPQYLTQLSHLSEVRSEALDDCSHSSSAFDKIPSYLKGFHNYNESDQNIMIELNEAYIEVTDVFFDNHLHTSQSKSSPHLSVEDFLNSDSSNYSTLMSAEESKDFQHMNDIMNEKHLIPQSEQIECNNSNSNHNSNNSNINELNRKSRSRSRDKIKSTNNSNHNNNKNYVSSSGRRRRLSTRSSVDCSSDSKSSRSSSCSSCSSSSSDSYLSDESIESNHTEVNYKLSTSIIRNEKDGQDYCRKRSLKESYCQSKDRSKIRANYDITYNTNVVNNVKNVCKSVSTPAAKDIDERKIIYVGKIADGTTKTDVRRWFGRFGAIKEVSVHFRDYGDNYAFVTFYKRCDAFEAIERANDDKTHPKFDLSFGGRRQFCKTRYEDLDYADDQSFASDRMDFDSLLRSTQAKITR